MRRILSLMSLFCIAFIIEPAATPKRITNSENAANHPFQAFFVSENRSGSLSPIFTSSAAILCPYASYPLP
jgi:hypothetical protein